MSLTLLEEEFPHYGFVGHPEICTNYTSLRTVEPASCRLLGSGNTKYKIIDKC